ncbi:branched-chain amino acid aminotransferase [Halosimplex carlsbadense 2-9-1]|uniref:Branched-chain amino acid aminotransferase n=1 Tax=Halosimplex carlsbadense 2-9-1 TaxID=797114 RepID=M0CY99_9EURY|nr:aminotransferase class IV [Halosimplex carlsbadense]ELZ27412.1 branched-chain amino acid aminotransferase [Halosimplex carlsbadense 2-9-1]
MSGDESSDDSAPLTYHVNGDLVPADEATVSVRDRGFMYGDGAFETLRVYGGAPFEWTAHRDRLRRTAETLGFADAVPDDLRERVDATLAANDLSEAYCKVSVTRGVQPGKLTPDSDVDPTVVVYVSPLDRGGVEGSPAWSEPATVQTVRTRRPPTESLPADAKTHNYLPGVLARIELRRAATAEFAADEAVMRTTDDSLAEGATSNIFFVDGGTLKTPSTDLPILPGVTRSVAIELAESEGFSVRTGSYTLDDLRDADEVFLTNSTWEIRPVTSVDGIDVSVGPMTRLLSRLFDERVEREHYGGTDDGVAGENDDDGPASDEPAE